MRLHGSGAGPREEILRHYGDAIERADNPSSKATYHKNRGHYYTDLGETAHARIDYESAIRQLRRHIATEKRPFFKALGHREVAKLDLKLGRPDAAEAAYGRAIAADPGEYSHLWQRADFYCAQGQPRKSLDDRAEAYRVVIGAEEMIFVESFEERLFERLREAGYYQGPQVPLNEDPALDALIQWTGDGCPRPD